MDVEDPLYRLPPLDCLLFFEAAARCGSFRCAAEEMRVTAPAVAQRIRTLEDHLGCELFARSRRSVRLNARGRTYHAEVERLLAGIHGATERHRAGPNDAFVRVVSAASVAERWLMPRLRAFKAAHPGTTVELETNHGAIDPRRRDFDVWIEYALPAGGPHPDGACEELLFEESLLPVCSPALLERMGRPGAPDDLGEWPLVNELGRESDWTHWFARQGAAPAKLTYAWGFRLHGMVVEAAVAGMGAALGHSALVARELRAGELVPVFESGITAPARCCLFTTPVSRQKREVEVFRGWLQDASAGCADEGSGSSPEMAAGVPGTD